MKLKEGTKALDELCVLLIIESIKCVFNNLKHMEDVIFFSFSMLVVLFCFKKQFLFNQPNQY